MAKRRSILAICLGQQSCKALVPRVGRRFVGLSSPASTHQEEGSGRGFGFARGLLPSPESGGLLGADLASFAIGSLSSTLMIWSALWRIG